MEVQDDEDDRVVGRDASGCVKFTINRHGEVADVSVSTAWRDRIGESGLGRALVSAAADARRKLAADFASRAETTPEEAGDRAGEIFEEFRDLTPAQQNEALFAAVGRLDAATAELGRTLEWSDDFRSTTFTGSDEGGRVTVELSGPGELVAVALNDRWLGTTGVESLVTAVREALFAARDTRRQTIAEFTESRRGGSHDE